MTVYEFKTPSPIYLCQVTIYGETFYTRIKPGQTATPKYHPATKQVTWDITDPTTKPVKEKS